MGILGKQCFKSFHHVQRHIRQCGSNCQQHSLLADASLAVSLDADLYYGVFRRGIDVVDDEWGVDKKPAHVHDE
jgi:hypothetical protein